MSNQSWPTWPQQWSPPVEARPSHLIPRYTPHAQTPAHQRRAYRPKEVAALYGVGLSTVYDALYAGTLAGHRAGRSWVIPVEAIESWLNGAASRL